MKTKNIVLILIAGFVEISTAVAQDLFPLKQLGLGMTSQQFTSLFPHAKTAFDKKEAGILVDCLAFVTIPTNSFWNAGGIRIAEGRVASLAYIQTEDFGRGF